MRINYIDALKGLACIIVFIFHFNAAFIVDGVFLQNIPNPIGFLVDGSWAVYLFLFLSGFSITMSLQKNNQFQDLIIKRYFRLALPVALIQIIAYALGLMGLFTNDAVSEVTNNDWIGHFYTDFNVVKLLKGLVFAVPWGNEYSASYIAPAWMLTYVFWGTFLVVCLHIACDKLRNKKVVVIYSIFTVICLTKYSFYFASVILGSFLALFYNSIISRNGHVKTYALSVICFVAGLIWYDMHLHPVFSSALIVLSFVLNPWIQKKLSNGVLLFLGRISLWVYLIHWLVICSIGGSIFLWYYDCSPEKSYYISFFVCLLVTIIISYFFMSWFDSLFGRFIRRFVEYIKS